MTLADLFNPQQWIGAYSPAASKEGLQFASTLPMFGGVSGASTLTKMFGTRGATKKVVESAPKIAPAISSVGKYTYGLAGAGAGIIGGGILGFLGGGSSKKDATLTAAPQEINPVITPVVQQTPVIVQPNIQNTYTDNRFFDYSINTITDSPFAQIKKQVSPSTAVSSTPSWTTPITADQNLPFNADQTQRQGVTQSDGTNMALIAAIIAVGVIGYGYVSKPRRKSK